MSNHSAALIGCWALAGAMLLGLAPGFGIAQQRQALDASGGVTVVGQWANDDDVRPELVTSFDLFLEARLHQGTVHLYVEANTSPFRDGVSRRIPEVNTDAGTALNRSGEGRIQISELRLTWPIFQGSHVHLGLLDATGFLDVSQIANDENLFFLGGAFVNNPTIEFPDYALGAGLDGGLTDNGKLCYAVILTSSNGLADNPDVSYSQLLDVVEDEKGVFSGAKLRWKTDVWRASIGGWVNTANHEILDKSGGGEANSGLFSVLGWSGGAHSLAGRLGVADRTVSLARVFIGLTYVWARRDDAFGLALGQTLATSTVPGLSDVVHAEAFARRHLLRRVFLTGSVQRIWSSAFGRADVSSPVWISSIRLSAEF